MTVRVRLSEYWVLPPGALPPHEPYVDTSDQIETAKAAARAPARASSLTDSESFALRRREDKRKDAQVDTPKTLMGAPDRWHLYRVVAG